MTSLQPTLEQARALATLTLDEPPPQLKISMFRPGAVMYVTFWDEHGWRTRHTIAVDGSVETFVEVAA